MRRSIELGIGSNSSIDINTCAMFIFMFQDAVCNLFHINFLLAGTAIGESREGKPRLTIRSRRKKWTELGRYTRRTRLTLWSLVLDVCFIVGSIGFFGFIGAWLLVLRFGLNCWFGICFLLLALLAFLARIKLKIFLPDLMDSRESSKHFGSP